MRLNYFEWSRAVCQPFNPNQLGLLVKLKLFTLWVGCSLKCDNPVGLAAHWTATRSAVLLNSRLLFTIY